MHLFFSLLLSTAFGQPAANVVEGTPLSDPAATGESGLQARIFFTTNRLGIYEPCECPSMPLGGLSQAAALVDSARADGPVFWFDTGDRFFRHDMAMTGTEEAARRLRAILLADAASVGGMDAMGVGRKDLGAGLEYLERLSVRAAFPVLSANLVTLDGQPIFQPSALISRGDLVIGVTSVLPAETSGREFRATDPKKAAKAEVAALREQGAQLVIVLSNLGQDQDKALARASKADLVLGSSSRELTTEGVVVGRARLGQAGSRGKYLGEARWYRDGKGKGPHVVVTTRPVHSGAGTHAGVDGLIEAIERRLGDPVLGVPPIPIERSDDPRLKGSR